MVACILGVATPFSIPCLTFPPHKPHSKPSHFIIAHPQTLKIRAFSVRTGNYKLPSIRGGGGNKHNLKFNQTLQALAADINGLSRVLGDNAVYASPKKNVLKLTHKSLLDKGKVAAFFLVKVSLWASLAASTVDTLIVVAHAFDILTLLNLSLAHHLPDYFKDIFCHLCSGRAIEIIFTYVFGDGDPNQGIEEKGLDMIGQYIALNGAVVTAEEVAPYLDPKTIENTDDESYMLPVLQLFNGQPKVDEEGNILYHFPSVNYTPLPRRGWGKEFIGRWVDRDIQVDKFLKETEWECRKGDAKDIPLAENLLYYNLICSMLGASTILSIRPRSNMSYIFLPLLMMYVIYAVSFLAIASKRPSSIKKINAEIIKRNEARERRAKALELPDCSLKRKLSSARAMAWQQDYERRELDRRLEMSGD